MARWVQPRMIALAMALASTGLTALPAAAQSSDQDARLRKIEAEVRALQRKVFPGADGRFFTPEVDTSGEATPAPNAAPATTAVTDILGRLQSLESQLAVLTAQTEVNTNAIARLTERLDTQGAAPGMGVSASSPQGTALPPAQRTGEILPSQPSQAQQPAEPAGPSPERIEAVQAIAKPQTSDAGDDEYVYGFRLWDAGFFPEAQQQLTLYLNEYPDHWRASYGRNLLGRAFLDDGKPREAAPWFLQNYQADKQGVRAADSLLFLAESMIAINDTNRACIALAEFSETYPAIASGRLSSQYQDNRGKVNCN